MDHLIDDNEILEQEQDMARLRHAHGLLATDFAAARTELEDLASRGSLMAMLYLAHAYKRRADADYAEAEKLYRAAYQRGSSSALLHLASLRSQRGDNVEAERLWREGAAKDDGPFMFWLAKLYLRQRDMKKDDQARDLLHRAHELGQLHAKHRLGLLFMKGRYGVRRMPRGAWLTLSSMVAAFWARRTARRRSLRPR